MRGRASASGKWLLVFHAVAEVLGKLTASASFEVPRGADVSLQVAVPAEWLSEGRTIEVELPRNLMCARCRGAGCDTCNQAGAITLRGKAELPEVVQVALPFQKCATTSARARAAIDEIQSSVAADALVGGRDGDAAPSSVQPVVIRLPECGGLPDARKGAIVRGFLLLEVGIAAEPSPNVSVLDDDEPLSSSKIPRAETRPSEKRITGEAFEPCQRPRADPAQLAGEPPSSRVARVGCSRPPIVEQRVVRASRHSVPELADLVVEPIRVHSGPSWRKLRPNVYWGIVLGLILGILALILL